MDDSSSNYAFSASGATTTGLIVSNDGHIGIGRNPSSNLIHIKSEGPGTYPLVIQSSGSQNIVTFTEDESGHGRVIIRDASGNTGAFLTGSGDS